MKFFRPDSLPHPGGIQEFITSGLRFKAVLCGEYTSLLVHDLEGKVVFRGAIIFNSWPKIKTAFESMSRLATGECERTAGENTERITD